MSSLCRDAVKAGGKVMASVGQPCERAGSQVSEKKVSGLFFVRRFLQGVIIEVRSNPKQSSLAGKALRFGDSHGRGS